MSSSYAFMRDGGYTPPSSLTERCRTVASSESISSSATFSLTPSNDTSSANPGPTYWYSSLSLRDRLHQPYSDHTNKILYVAMRMTKSNMLPMIVSKTSPHPGRPLRLTLGKHFRVDPLVCWCTARERRNIRHELVSRGLSIYIVFIHAI